MPKLIPFHNTYKATGVADADAQAEPSTMRLEETIGRDTSIDISGKN